MSTTHRLLGRSRLDTEEFEPFVVEGERYGEVHFVRNDELPRGPYRVALWRVTEEDLPCEFDYDFACDETMCVLEGELQITFDDGDKVLLREGDIVTVAAGTHSVWLITEPFKKLVVET